MFDTLRSPYPSIHSNSLEKFHQSRFPPLFVVHSFHKPLPSSSSSKREKNGNHPDIALSPRFFSSPLLRTRALCLPNSKIWIAIHTFGGGEMEERRLVFERIEHSHGKCTEDRAVHTLVLCFSFSNAIICLCPCLILCDFFPLFPFFFLPSLPFENVHFSSYPSCNNSFFPGPQIITTNEIRVAKRNESFLSSQQCFIHICWLAF